MRLVYKMQIPFRYSDSNLVPFYHRTTDISISIQVKIFTQDRSWSCKTARNTITPDMQNPTWTKFVRYLLLAFLKASHVANIEKFATFLSFLMP